MIGSTIMSVREMIDIAFGEKEVNKVNFKIIQAVLYILARQLRILERQVGVSFGTNSIDSTPNLSVTEIKLQAKATKPKKKSLKSNSKEFDKTPQDKKGKAETFINFGKSSDKSKHISKREGVTEQDLRQYIEDIEERREQVLRVVDQRANSREEPGKYKPMAPLDPEEYVQYEKLLVVETTAKDESSRKIGTPRLSIVTQHEFNELNEKVKELQKQFGAVGVGEFPENIQLMKELRRGASLTDAMSALQLSARINATELTLQNLMAILKDLAIRKGIHLDEDQVGAGKKQAQETSTDPSDESQWVSAAELDAALQKIQDEIMNKVRDVSGKTASNAENAIKIATNLEKGLSNVLKLDNRMEALEDNVSQFAERVNFIDTGLSSQMTQYQEQLTQMEHDLESAMESMAEAVANSSGDPAAVAELSSNLSVLQGDLDFTHTKQKELEHNQSVLSSALESLLQQIELLRDYKSDREEVADALRDKAGIDALNGLVTQEEYNAIRGEFEKAIKAAYNKFDSQELKWQQAIDDLQRRLDEKANISDVVKLRNDINEYLEILRNKIQTLMDIVGEPRAAAVSKVLFRDTACISCNTPAHMNMVEPNLPLLPTCSTPEERKSRPKEYGDHGVCYQGQPIPHPIDPSKGRICHRYCGGSHTTTGNAHENLAMGITVRPAGPRNASHEIGTDGKVYRTVDAEKEKKQCEECSMEQRTTKLPKQQQQVVQDAFMMEQSSFDFTPLFQSYDPSQMDVVSATPPFTED